MDDICTNKMTHTSLGSFNQPPVGYPINPPVVDLEDPRCLVTPWLARKKSGYAYVTGQEVKGRNGDAHRLVVEIFIGPIGNSLVLHRCGNSACSHIPHLYAGGPKENQRDMLLHKDARRSLRLAPPFPANWDIFEAYRPQPLPLSQEASLLPPFLTFSPGICRFSESLFPTYDGYRQLQKTDKSGELVGVHRLIYKLFRGPIDKYDIIEHSCLDRRCLNPHHIIKTGRQASFRDFNVKHDGRYKISEYGMKVISDLSQSAVKVASELNIHPQRVNELRVDIRRTQRLRLKEYRLAT